MLADAGATAVIVGHFERRTDHHESDDLVRLKAQAAWRAGLVAIVCVGETRGERDAGRALDVIGGQIAGSLPDGVTASNTVVAYEPVWAIGTGLTPTTKDVEEVHGLIRAKLRDRFSDEGNQIRILYGGSVKPSNAAELMAVANVDGALVGGASLKAADFLAIAAGCPESLITLDGSSGVTITPQSCTDRATSTPQAFNATGCPAPMACDGRSRCKPSLSSFIS